MGVRGLWPTISRKYKATRGGLPNDTLLVDLFATFFVPIRRNFQTKPLQQAVDALDTLLKARFDNLATVEIFVDGRGSREKEGTAQDRRRRAESSLVKAEAIVNTMEQKAAAGRSVSSAVYRRYNRNLAQSFIFSTQERAQIVQGLQLKGWTVHQASCEADVAIKQRCRVLTQAGVEFAVVTGDSDLLIHPEVPVIYRPTSKGQFLRYDVEECAEKLGISRSQLAALGVVCKNDYSQNVTGYGVASNLALIKETDRGTGLDIMLFILYRLFVVLVDDPDAFYSTISLFHCRSGTRASDHPVCSKGQEGYTIRETRSFR